MKFAILISDGQSHYIRQIGPGYLSSLVQTDEGVAPQFGPVPIYYSDSHAFFLFHELRRSGFYVCLVPYFLIVLRGRINLLVALLRQRRSARMKWKK